MFLEMCNLKKIENFYCNFANLKSFFFLNSFFHLLYVILITLDCFIASADVEKEFTESDKEAEGAPVSGDVEQQNTSWVELVDGSQTQTVGADEEGILSTLHISDLFTQCLS